MDGHEKLYSFLRQGSVPFRVRARDALATLPLTRWLGYLFLHLGFGTEPFFSLVSLGSDPLKPTFIWEILFLHLHTHSGDYSS